MDLSGKHSCVIYDSNHLPVYKVFDAANDFRNDPFSVSRRVFSGSFSADLPRLQVPKKKLMFFVSSTFTDTHAERDLLMLEIVPELREKGRRHGGGGIGG